MKPSKYIKNIARTNILKKTQRTWLSLVAICLSTAIIFTSMTLFKNVYGFSKNTDYEAIGNYHYAAYVKGEALSSPRFDFTIDADTGLYGSLDNQTINLRSLNAAEDSSCLPFVLKEGSLASSEDEIIVSDTLQKSVGDTLSLSLGNVSISENADNLYHLPDTIETADLKNQTEKTYTITGIYINNEVYQETHPGVEMIYTYIPELTEGVYYVKDIQVHLSDSFSYFLEKMNLNARDVLTNMDVVSNDSVKNYLQDTTVILAMFVIIACIAICMSLISVQNVVLISDKDRKKELGLLKSIGATPAEIKRLLQIELITLGILGALLGILLGSIVSYFVLNFFIERIYVTFRLSMIVDPVIILVSWIAGTILMYMSGMKAYSRYIYSSAISDLKDFSYEYGTPVVTKTRRKTFEWRMFLIYNGRMKKQTKNIFRSFALLLSTTVLFISIFLSNIIYVNKYVSKGYDFDISNYHGTVDEQGGLWEVDPEVSYQIYEEESSQQINANYIYAERLMITGSFWTQMSSYDEELLDSYKAVSLIGMETNNDSHDITYGNVYHYPAAFDKVQLEELKPYLVDGAVDDLSSNEVVAVFSEGDRLGYEFCNGFKIGDEVAYDIGNEGNLGNKKTIAAIAVIPKNAFSGLHFDYDDYPRVLAFSVEALVADGQGADMSEHIYIDLMNASTATSVQDTLSNILEQSDNLERYVLDSIAITVETNRFATFIIQALLYPLFFMLFIVSLMNINNVFVGNVHLKRNDISIMKSVGMTGSQLNMLFTFEYVEGYLNAAALVSVIFIIMALLENYLQIASSFDFAANIFGTLLISVMLLGVIMVTPLIIITLRKIREILPIENLKDVD